MTDEQGLRILAVEDEPTAQLMLRSVIAIQSNGSRWTCDIAETLEDAIDKDATGEYDVVVLDLNLPDSDAEETVDRISEFKTPVVISSSVDDQFTIRRCIEEGAKGFVCKFNLEAMGAVLRQQIVAAIHLAELDQFSRAMSGVT